MKTGYKVAATAALVAVGASGFYARTREEPRAEDRPTAPAKVVLPELGFSGELAATITRIELTQGEPRQSVALEKTGSDWRVTSPVNVKASAPKVAELLENLRALKVTEAVDRGVYAFDVYELTDAAAFHVVASNGDRKVSDLYFGKSDTLKRFIRIAGVDGVFAVANRGPGGYSGFLYTRGLRSWRDASVLSFSEDDATEVEITNKNGRFSFAKSGGSWSGTHAKRDAHGKLRAPEPAWPAFDENRIKELLHAFQSLSADDFGDDAQKAASGVDHAEETGGVLRIRLRDGLGDRTVRIGKVSTNTGRWAIAGSRWATVDGSDGALYALAPWTSGWATANAGQFEAGAAEEGGAATMDGAPGSMTASTGSEH